MFSSIKKVLLVSLGIFLSLYIVLTLLFPSNMVDIVGFRTFIVISPSMEPEIMVYDMILITDVKETELEEGDIITFEAYIPELNDYSYVTHYLALIEEVNGETVYKTQGAYKPIGDYDEWTDNNGNPVDITFEDVEGRYKLTVPLLGPFIHRIQDPIFLGLLVINSTIIYLLFKFTIQYKNNKNDKEKEIN